MGRSREKGIQTAIDAKQSFSSCNPNRTERKEDGIQLFLIATGRAKSD